MNRRIVIALSLIIALVSCQSPSGWQHERTIELGEISPIGLAVANDQIWVADSDHNQVILIDPAGKILLTIDSLDRPMHIDATEESIYIPEYGKDEISIWSEGSALPLDIPDGLLDAPAGVSVWKSEVAIADFYNNRVLYSDGSQWLNIGQEGKADGEFHYPTDVQITEEMIYVADAYNHRVQSFDKKGNHLLTIGENAEINAATGLYLSDDELYITDFENDRVLIYTHEGEPVQVIAEGLDKPTDMIIVNDQLWIANYRAKNIMVYTK